MPSASSLPPSSCHPVAKDVQAWLTDNPTRTVAVLVPSNPYGTEMAALLREMGIEHVEMLRNTTDTRKVVGSVYRIVRLISEPLDARYLIEAYRVWMRDLAEAEFIDADVALLRGIKRMEAFIMPGSTSSDWLEQAVSSFEDPERFERLNAFRATVARWMRAALLPIDQLVLVIAGDIFTHPADIATAHSLAIHMGIIARQNPGQRLPDFSSELSAIASNTQKFIGIGADDQQFDPARYPGKAVIMTMHGAKGLEWDRVYLMSVNNYDFPGLDAGSSFRSERWYVRDGLSLQAEALAQLHSLRTGAEYVEGAATQEDRVKIVAEKLRLLYVGITRAKSSLMITWNTGRETRGLKLTAAAPIPRLYEWSTKDGR
jgi:DNA helicase II / ATP-dependent DNA helicase PcrA